VKAGPAKWANFTYLARFLDRWEEIKAAYARGWNYKRIWQTLHNEGQFTFGYGAFCNYARKMKRRLLVEKEKGRVKEQTSPFGRRAGSADEGRQIKVTPTTEKHS
jgi:hypothetical protein